MNRVILDTIMDKKHSRYRYGHTYILDNVMVRLTDGVQVVSLNFRPPFTARKIPATYFCYRLSQSHGHNAVGRIRSTEKFDDLIENRIDDLYSFVA
jgi:hypothetical protein